MVVYIIGFVLSTMFVWLSERKKQTWFFGFLAVAILTLIAAVRDVSIGTDIHFYVLKTFGVALKYKHNLIGYMFYNPDQVEPLYLLIEYAAANLFHNVHFALFVFSVVTNSFVYLSLKNLRGKLSSIMGWIAYCLLFYPVTLNLMRQAMAISVIFYLFSQPDKLNWKRVIVLSALAAGFHVSGFMGFFLYAIYEFLEAGAIRQTILKQIGIGIFLLLPFFADVALKILVSVGLFSGKFTSYLDTRGQIALGNMAFRSIGLAIYFFYLYRNKAVRQNNWSRFILYVGVVDILFLVDNGLFAMRVGKTFSIFEIIYFTMGLKVFENKEGSRQIAGIIVVTLMFAFWVYQFVFLNSGEVYPYMIDQSLFV